MSLCPRDGMKICFWRLVTTCKSYSLNSHTWPRVMNLFKFATFINMFIVLLWHPLIEHEFCRSNNTLNSQKLPHTQISDIQALIYFNSYRSLFTLSLITPHSFMFCTNLTYKSYHVLFYFMFSTYFYKWTNRFASIFTSIRN